LTFVAPVTPVINISGGYILLGENAAGSMYSTAGTTGKATMYVLATEYKMSKRTSLYASYATLSNDTVGSKFSLTTTVGTADKNPSDMRIGMRHTF
jgi:predicted porin